MTKERNLYLSFFLSLILPGLGHIYHGWWRKGLIISSLTFIWNLIDIFLLNLVVLNVLFSIFLVVYSFFDLYSLRKRKTPFYFHSVYNRPLIYFFLTFVSITPVILGEIFNTRSVKSSNFIFQPQQGSMLPTLKKSDYLFLEERPKQIKRGEIIAFKKAGEVWGKRVIGGPNDHIRIHNNEVYVNGQAMPKTPIAAVKDLSFFDDYEQFRNIRDFQFYETSLDGKKFMIIGRASVRPIYKNVEMIIPLNHYFVLGDNRDYSYDSRFEDFGLVHEEEIIGKFIFIVWSKNWGRIGEAF